MNWIEILGYAASLLVAASLSMKSVARLRALNLLGSLAFTLYGLILGVYPVMVVNAYITVINIIFLLRMQPGHSEAFELLAIGNADNRYLGRFLEHHGDDIVRFFPRFTLAEVEDPVVIFILRDMLPVGLVVGHSDGRGDLVVDLDYVVPSHRDFRCAEYFYRSWDSVIPDMRPGRFLAHTEVPAHERYLRKMGFGPLAEGEPGWFARPA